MSSSEKRAYLGLVLVFVIWGSLYVVSMVVLESLPAFLVMFFRFAIAFLTLSLIVKVRSRNWAGGVNEQGKKTRLDREAWKYVWIMGAFGYAVSVGVQLLGTKFAGSSMASLINSLNPVTISLMAVPVLHEKLTGNKIAGIGMAVFGVYLILGTGGQASLPGVLLSLASVFGWSMVSVLTRRGLSVYEPLVITRAAVGIAAICEIPIAAAEYFVSQPAVSFSLPVILGLLYLGIVCTGLAYILWNQGLAALPASNCSALYPVQPLTSTVMGVLFFKESVGLPFALGTACIIAGVLVCLLYKSREKE